MITAAADGLITAEDATGVVWTSALAPSVRVASRLNMDGPPCRTPDGKTVAPARPTAAESAAQGALPDAR